MGLFDRIRQVLRPVGEAEPSAPPEPEENELEIYAGMRVEISAFNGQVLFIAKLMSLMGNTAQLHQYTEYDSKEPEEGEEVQPLRVRIRGYNDRERKAVYMEGTITPLPQHKWQVEDLVVARIGNDRAFFRLDTNLDASLTTFSGFSSAEVPCKLLNISVGGACVSTGHAFREGDKFLLKVQMLEDREMSVIYCQVLRITSKEDQFEYGCRFLELNESDQDRITRNIFTVQRQQRNGGR